MNCRVVVEAAVPVYDVETPDEALRIAISKTGEMLNPDLNYVEINGGERTSPSGEELPPAFIAADEALVALELEMTVFNVEREEHASRIARKEIGQLLTNIPLEVLQVDVLDEEESREVDQTTDDEPEPENSDTESSADADADSVDDTVTQASEPEDDGKHGTEETDPLDDALDDELETEIETESGDDTKSGTETAQSSDTDPSEDVLPEFEEMLDE